MESKFICVTLAVLLATFVFLIQFLGLDFEEAKETIKLFFEFSLIYAVHTASKCSHNG